MMGLTASGRKVIYVAVSALLIFAAVPAYAYLNGITKTIIGGTTTLLAGNTVGYEITVGPTAACGASTDSFNVVVEDLLPTDANGNQQTTFVSADCASTAPGATVPACIGGTATQVIPGTVRWVFPGNSCAGTLTMHIFLRLNDNLVDGTAVTNRAQALDDGGDHVGPAAAPAVTVKSSTLQISDLFGTPSLKSAVDVATTAAIANNASVSGGQTIQYSFNVKNIGTTDSNGVVIQDTLPPGLTFVAGSAIPNGFPNDCTVCGAFSGGVLSWQYDVIHPGQTRGVSYRATVEGSLLPGTILFNVATAVDATGHLALGTHTVVASSPCLSLTKIVSDCRHQESCGGDDKCSGITAPGSENPLAAPGPTDIVTYTIKVANSSATGCATANGVTITDAIPQGMTFQSCTPAASCSSDGANVTFSAGTVAAGGDATVTVKLEVNQGVAKGTVLTDVATAKAANGGTATASRSVTVEPPVLQLTKVSSPSPIEPGGSLTYAFIISNAGKNCAKAVALTDVLPSTAHFMAGSFAASVGCGAAPVTPVFTADGSKFVLPEFDLAAGATCKGTFDMLVPEATALGGTVLNTMTAADKHLNKAPDAVASTPINSRLLDLSKFASGCTLAGAACDPSGPPPGAQVDYTITASAGPFIATGVTVIDTLPSSLNTANPPVPVARFVSTTCTSPSLAGSVLTCNLKDIAPNSSATFHVIIGLDSSDAPGTQIVNSATVSDDARDLLAVSVIDVVRPVGGTEPTPTPTPAVQLQVSVGARNSTRRGRHLAFLITVQNTGVATATNVMVSDSIPSVLRLFRVPRIRGLRGACSGNRPAGVFTCNLGDLPPGASKSFKAFTFVRFLRSGGPNTGDTIRNTVTATSAEGVMASGTSSTTVIGRSRSRR